MLNNSGMSIADVAALTNRCGYGGYNYGGYGDGFFGGNGWLGGLIIGSLLSRGLFGGFGGFGGFIGAGTGLGLGFGQGFNQQVSNDFIYTNLSNQMESTRNDMSSRLDQLQTNDFNISKDVQQTNFNTAVGQASLSREIGQVGYQSALGNKDIALEISNTGCATQGAIKDASYNALLGNQNILAKLAECCCSTNGNIDELKFVLSKELCGLGYKMDMNTRDTIANDNINAQKILDAVTNLRIENKDTRIAELTAQVSALQTNGIATQAADAAVNRILQLFNASKCNPCGC